VTNEVIPVDMVFKLPNLYLMNVQRETLGLFASFVSEYALLPNDTIHALTCYDNEIEEIATNDLDFERVDSLKIWKA
jgi:predicted nucleic acid-binding protein